MSGPDCQQLCSHHFRLAPSLLELFECLELLHSARMQLVEAALLAE